MSFEDQTVYFIYEKLSDSEIYTTVTMRDAISVTNWYMEIDIKSGCYDNDYIIKKWDNGTLEGYYDKNGKKIEKDLRRID